MGSRIEFASASGSDNGYLAAPSGPGEAPGVLVIQEYWGLVPHIEDVCDRFAAAGFTALAPDLYHGETASEPDEAAKLMMGLRLERAAADLSGAVDELGRRSSGRAIGVVGFCMGGSLALVLAGLRADVVRAVVPFYGGAWDGAEPDYPAIAGAVLGHFAERDEWATPARAAELEAKLRAAGNDDVEIHVYEGTDHAFFNDDRPEVYAPEAAALAWGRTVAFLRERLG